MKKRLGIRIVLMGIITVLSCNTVQALSESSFIDRGIRQSVFVPKGQWVMGASFSHRHSEGSDYKYVVIEDLSGEHYTYSFSPFAGYFFKNDWAIGGRFTYKRTKYSLDEMSLNLGDDLSFELSGLSNIEHSYMGTVFVRQYTGIENSKRFGFLSEMRLSLGGGQAKFYDDSGSQSEGTYQRSFNAQLGFTPGLVAFVTNQMAVELLVNVLGFEYTHIDQTTNQIYKGKLDKSGMNFKIDLFSIQLGVTYYLSYNAKK